MARVLVGVVAIVMVTIGTAIPNPMAQESGAGGSAADLQREVVAKVGGRTITLAEFNRMLQRDGQNPEGKLSAAQKKAALEQLVTTLLFLEEAKRLRLQEQPEVAARIQEATAQVLISEYARLNVAEHARVEESELKPYWESHPEEFTVPLQVQARHILIVVPASGTEGQAVAKAEAILARVRAGEDFAAVATELSNDSATRARGGDLGFFGPGKMAPEFEKAAFAMKPGEVSGPVKTSFGYHLIKVEGRRESFRRPFESVKPMIEIRLSRERQKNRVQALVRELKTRFPTEVNVGLFDVEE